MDTEYYDVLGLPKDADTNQIKKAFRKMAMKYHPDKNKGDAGSEEKFKEIAEAYEILSDSEKKKMYDMHGKAGLEQGSMGGHNVDIAEIIRRMQQQGGMRGMPGMPGMSGMETDEMTVPPVECFENISLKDVYFGKHVKKTIDRHTMCSKCNGSGNKDGKDHSCDNCKGSGVNVSLRRMGPMIQQVQMPCSSCQGSGGDTDVAKCKSCNGSRAHEEKSEIEFDIPPGVAHRQQVVVPNMGNDIPHKDRKNDIERSPVVVHINEQGDDTFKRGFQYKNERSPANLLLILEVSLAESLCGFRKKIPYLDGTDLIIEDGGNIIGNDTVRIIPGKGLPVYEKPHKMGDLYVKFKIIYPEEMDSDTKLAVWKSLTGTDSNKDKDEELPEGQFPVHTMEPDAYLAHKEDMNDSDSDEDGNVQCAMQ